MYSINGNTNGGVVFGLTHIPQFSWPQWAIPWVRWSRIIALVSLGLFLLGVLFVWVHRQLQMPKVPVLTELPFLIPLLLVSGVTGIFFSAIVTCVLAAVCDLIDAWKKR